MTRTLISLFSGIMVLSGGAALAGELTFEDPKGDDKGPGNYVYPTDAVYTKGSFDLTKLELEDDGDNIEVTATVNAKVDDPWDSKAWEGQGFSVQMFFIYLDLDGKGGEGHVHTHSGLNVDFVDDNKWDKAMIISAQGNRRVQAELGQKAKDLKDDTALPVRVKVKGKKIQAWFKKSDVGGGVSAIKGLQIIVQSNEGYPTKTDLLTRRVNEFNGKHRFGGGSDYMCDPHAMDILAGAAKGDASEAKAQYDQLGTFKCDAEGNGSLAKISMVYPAK